MESQSKLYYEPDGRKEVIAYVPVLHRGYLDFIEAHRDSVMHIVGDELIDELPHLRKDINALTPDQSLEIVRRTFKMHITSKLGRVALEELVASDSNLVLPDDEVSRHLMVTYMPNRDNVELYPIFLRWDRKSTLEPTELKGHIETISAASLDSAVLARLTAEASQAANMWRRVGAVLVKDGAILDSSHNQSVPTSYTQSIEGDPRNSLHRGDGIEFSNDHHAEAKLIARMAKNGISTANSELYVTDFPCPVCAKDIAEAGIDAVYYGRGYSVLDGQRVLQSNGVSLVRITELIPEDTTGPEWRPYTKTE